jgi:hypothetical protein
MPANLGFIYLIIPKYRTHDASIFTMPTANTFFGIKDHSTTLALGQSSGRANTGTRRLWATTANYKLETIFHTSS